MRSSHRHHSIKKKAALGLALQRLKGGNTQIYGDSLDKSRVKGLSGLAAT